MPDFERPDTPDTPEFLDELEGRLRMAARKPPARPLRIPRWRPDWIAVQRYLMPVGMSAMAFVVAAAVLLPSGDGGLMRQPSTTVPAPDGAVAAAPIGVPDDAPADPLLIDGRYSLAELAAPTDTTDETVRSAIR